MAGLGKSGQASGAQSIYSSVHLFFFWLAFMDLGLFISFRGSGTSPEILAGFLNPFPWVATDRSKYREEDPY